MSSISYPMPNLNSYLEQWWGGSWSVYGWEYAFTVAANIYVGGNPPLGPNEFFAMYPKFGGAPIPNLTGDAVLGSASVTLGNATVPPELTIGQYISCVGTIAVASRIIDIQGQVLTLDKPAIADGTGINLLVYPTPIVSPPALLMYINLAHACIRAERWNEQWLYGMCLFIAHYCTLYLWSEGNPGTSAGSIAQSGLQHGIMITKLAGDVSAGYQLPKGLDDWGTYVQTTYGAQLATLAKIVGWGPMYIW
jgi:Protein of unknown function (DUF4054)